MRRRPHEPRQFPHLLRAVPDTEGEAPPPLEAGVAVEHASAIPVPVRGRSARIALDGSVTIRLLALEVLPHQITVAKAGDAAKGIRASSVGHD